MTEFKFQEKDLEEVVVKITSEIVEDVVVVITEMLEVKDMIVIMDTTLLMLINIAGWVVALHQTTEIVINTANEKSNKQKN